MTTLFSRSEIFALSLINGGNWMLGIAPEGLLPSDKTALAALRDEGLERLRRRDFIRVTPAADGSAEVTAGENLAGLCDALFQAQKVLVVSKGNHRAGYQSVYFHRGRGGYSEQTLVGDDTHAIAFFDTGAAFDLKLFALLPATGGAEASFDATEAAVAAAIRQSAEGKPVAAQPLSKDAGAEAFVASLTGLDYIGVATLMDVDRVANAIKKNTFTLIVTQTQAWVMAQRDAERVNVTALTEAGWRELMTDIAVRFAG
jgi:hypothetical protein